jgi:hypothetical protein
MIEGQYCRVGGLGYRIQDVQYRVYGFVRFRVEGLRFKV